MSEFFTLLVTEMERGWVWMYTSGMPEEARAERVDELASDAWEHEADAGKQGRRFGLEFLQRFVMGMPADLRWRTSQGREGLEARNSLELLVAILLGFGLLVALPLAAALLPMARQPMSGHPTLGGLVLAECLVAILLLVLPGVLVIERWPVAGGLLVTIGCLCLMALFWWLREAMGVILAGTGAGAWSALRLHRLQGR